MLLWNNLQSDYLLHGDRENVVHIYLTTNSDGFLHFKVLIMFSMFSYRIEIYLTSSKSSRFLDVKRLP